MTAQQALDLAKSHYDSGADDQVKAILGDLARAVPREPVVWKLSGAASLRLGDPEKAIECTERCLSLNPNDGNAWGLLGEALCDCKNHTAAIDAYLQFVRPDPDTIVSHERLMLLIGSFRDRPVVSEAARKWSSAFADTDRFEGAAETLEKRFRKDLEVTSDFRHALVLRNIASILFVLGRPEDAIAAYTKSTLPIADAARARGKTVDDIRSAFKELSPVYDDVALPQRVAARMATFVGNAVRGRSGLRVLDAACGTGLLRGHLRDMAEHLVGVDLSPELIDIARKKKIYHELVCGDLVQAMEERADRFDLVTCCGALYFLADLTGFFAAAAPRLAPGGVLAFTLDPCSDQFDVTMTAEGEYAHSRR